MRPQYPPPTPIPAPLAEDQEEIESQRQTELDPGRFCRTLWNQELGRGVLRPRRRRFGNGQCDAGRQARQRQHSRHHRRHAAARAADAGAAAYREPAGLPDHPAQRDLCKRHSQPELPRQLPRCVPDQGEPAVPGDRGDRPLRRGLRARPRMRQQGRTVDRAGESRPRRQPYRLQRLQGRGVHHARPAVAEARLPLHLRDRDACRAPGDPRVLAPHRREADPRPAREARLQSRRLLEREQR